MKKQMDNAKTSDIAMISPVRRSVGTGTQPRGSDAKKTLSDGFNVEVDVLAVGLVLVSSISTVGVAVGNMLANAESS